MNEIDEYFNELARCPYCKSLPSIRGRLFCGEPRDYAVRCECGAQGPFCETSQAAGETWNDLMRPRPVAEWGSPGGVTYLYVGRAVLGYVLTSQSGSESAVCVITGEHFRGYDARAWLEERVSAEGFEVEETTDE